LGARENVGRPTIADVARLAGVSRATVSYVLSGRSKDARISDDTQQRVTATAKELGYRPSLIGRSLRTSKTEMIALAVQDITNPFYPLVSVAVQETVEEFGYDLLIYNFSNKPGRERAFLDLVSRRRPDGVIIFAWSLAKADLESLVAQGISVVCFSGATDFPEVDTVGYDQAEGVRQAMGHLYSKGHHRIGHIAGALSTPTGRDRLAGYKEALAEYSLPFDPDLVKEGDFRRGSGRSPMLELLRVPERPTAVFVANDIMAMDAVLAAQGAGLRVPEDIAIIGFDDIPEALVLRPPLTTVRQDPWELGAASARLILERLKFPASDPGHLVLRPQLIIRHTV
jgi:DNA-binding LacI/PurR family transcriptional regulator